MKVTMLLCDAAEASEGKLFILGGGWTITGPGPSPSAVALLIEVPWDQANHRNKLVLELLNEDGQPVIQPGPIPVPARVETEFEVGRPAGIAPGTPLTVPLAVSIGPMQLTPGGRYYWKLTLNGESHEDWRLPFSVRPMPILPGGFGPAEVPPSLP